MADSCAESSYEGFIDEKIKPITPNSYVIKYNNKFYTEESWKQLRAEKIKALKEEEIEKNRAFDFKLTNRLTIKGILTKDKIQSPSTCRICFNCQKTGHERPNCPKEQI